MIYFIGFAKNGKAYKFFVYYLLTIGAVQFAMEVYAGEGRNNHFLSTYYLFSQFILLSYFFYYLFLDIKRSRSLFIKYASAVIIAGLLIQYSIYPGLYFTFNSLGFLVTSCMLIIYAVMYLYELLSKKLPFYYAIIGVFIYLISSSLIFASAVSIMSFADEINLYIWKINGLLFILYQLLILWEWKQTFYLKPANRG
jgi:hypothetical protein